MTEPERPPERDDDIRFPDPRPFRRIQLATVALIVIAAVITLTERLAARRGALGHADRPRGADPRRALGHAVAPAPPCPDQNTRNAGGNEGKDGRTAVTSSVRAIRHNGGVGSRIPITQPDRLT